MATMQRELRGETVTYEYVIYVNGNEVDSLFVSGSETFDPTDADEYGDIDGGIYEINSDDEVTVVVNPVFGDEL